MWCPKAAVISFNWVLMLILITLSSACHDVTWTVLVLPSGLPSAAVAIIILRRRKQLIDVPRQITVKLKYSELYSFLSWNVVIVDFRKVINDTIFVCNLSVHHIYSIIRRLRPETSNNPLKCLTMQYRLRTESTITFRSATHTIYLPYAERNYVAVRHTNPLNHPGLGSQLETFPQYPSYFKLAHGRCSNAAKHVPHVEQQLTWTRFKMILMNMSNWMNIRRYDL